MIGLLAATLLGVVAYVAISVVCSVLRRVYDANGVNLFRRGR